MFALSITVTGFFVLLISTRFCDTIILDDITNLLETLNLLPMLDRGPFVTPPESALSALEIIRFYGYPVERHIVQTIDGYLLEVHRIPHGRRRKRENWKGSPIYLQHGLMGSSAHFLINGLENNLAFILAEEGYDVWLGNFRGNRYSRRHRRLSPDDPLFWEFNGDDYGVKDVPAMIDYILKMTDESQLIFLGHSLGATSIFSMLSTLPEYNEKVKVAICLAPVVYVRYLRTAIRIALNNIELLKNLILPISSTKELFRSSEGIRQIIRKLCSNRYGKLICEAFVYLFVGYNEDLMDLNRINALMTHLSSLSVNVFDHFSQLYRSNRAVRYDYGPERNLIEYGTDSPPEYNITMVTAPIAVFWGYMDAFTDKRDLDRLVDQIPNLRLLEMVNYDLWSHADFVFAKDAKKHLYGRLLQVVNEFNTTLR